MPSGPEHQISAHGEPGAAAAAGIDSTSHGAETEFSDADLDRLDALARAATPGTWTARPFGRVVGGPAHEYANGSTQGQLAMFCVTSDPANAADEPERQQSNTEFCAAVCPEVLLKLTAALRKAR